MVYLKVSFKDKLMAAHTAVDPQEEKFRQESRWLSFKSQAWGALGMATFFGALMTIAMGIVSVAMGTPAILENGMITPSAPLLSVSGIAALGGLLGFGAAATYMSQRDATELRIVQDEHMAQQQAKCMKQDKSPVIAIEHEQNCRADGKKWGDIVANQNQPQHVTAR